MISVFEVLSASEAAGIAERLDPLLFGSGRRTAGPLAAPVKANEELESEALRADLERLIADRLARNPTFPEVALPRRIEPIIFSRYAPGMQYGAHFDEPLHMSGGLPFRLDLSMTLFLVPPDSYDGGELVVNCDTTPTAIKLPAGQAVIYPAKTMHRVNPVTRGVRIAAVTWIESCVRSDDERQVLWKLSLAADRMKTSGLCPTSPDLEQAYGGLLHIRALLVRMWADT